jgi:transcriptional regulator with XRE-family HTH domain
MWLKILKQQIADKGPRQVGRELGVSHSTLSLVMSGKYGASTRRVEERVRAIYGNPSGMVDCPARGEMPPADCAENWRRAKLIGMKAGNPETLRLYKTQSRRVIRYALTVFFFASASCAAHQRAVVVLPYPGSLYLSGEREPGAYNLQKIATMLHISLDWLLLGKGISKPTKQPLDLNFMKEIITVVEEIFQQEKLYLPPAKKAELISLLYEDLSEDKSKISAMKGTVIKLVKLAS